MKAILVLALVTSPPALADLYRCTSGSKTIYQDEPCANAKPIENINGLPPSRAEQAKAIERANRDRRLAANLHQDRKTTDGDITVTQTALHPIPAALKPNKSGRYYDRPDRFQHRTVSGPSHIQNP